MQNQGPKKLRNNKKNHQKPEQNREPKSGKNRKKGIQKWMPKNDVKTDRQINRPRFTRGSVFEPAGGLGGPVKFRIVTGKTKRNLKTPCTRRGAADVFWSKNGTWAPQG